MSTLLDSILKENLTKVAIFSGAGVDPDGLASQLAMASIIRLNSGTPHCFYRGSFDHPQNRIMRSELGLTPKSINKFDPEDDWSLIISVDGPAEVCPAHPHYIIDHHDPGEPGINGSDVRSTGSASSILWEYAVKAGVDFETEEGKKLATSLAIGILTDTRTCAIDAATELDFKALAFCLENKDNNIYKNILNYPKPAYYNNYYVLGWNNKVVEGTVMVTGLGKIPQTRRGVLPYLAEVYTENEEINTAVIVALIDNQIDISVRSTTPMNLDEFVKVAFNAGGGKRGAAAAQIALPSMFDQIEEKLVDQWFDIILKIVANQAFLQANDGVRLEDKQDM